jgi:hypothetical protein
VLCADLPLHRVRRRNKQGVRLQCGLFTFDEDVGYSAEDAAALEARAQRMHILLLDVSHERTLLPWPPHWHYVPYKTNLHYVPRKRGRDVAIAAPVATDPFRAPWDYATARVNPPPRALPWAPEALSQYGRPLLATYIGFNSRIRKERASQLLLFSLKHQARRRRTRLLLRVFCAQVPYVACFCAMQARKPPSGTATWDVAICATRSSC